jgi:DNA-binding transcriptional LysR family regulator
LPAAFEPATWRGQVTIAATDHQTIMLLPRLMARLSREAPRLDVKVVPFLSAMRDELRAGRIDLAFGVAELDPGSGLRHGGAVPRHVRDAHAPGPPCGGELTLERFVGLDHVLVTVLGDGRGVLDEELARLGRPAADRAAAAALLRGDGRRRAKRPCGDLAPLDGLLLPGGVQLIGRDPPLARPPFTIRRSGRGAGRGPGATWLRTGHQDEASRVENVMPWRGR